MKHRLSGLLAITAFISCFLASVPIFAQNAYITNNSSTTVSVIDTASDTVSAIIPVGSGPVAFGLFIQSSTAAPAPNAHSGADYTRTAAATSPTRSRSTATISRT
jgi:YVTN family beta-propeller protein